MTTLNDVREYFITTLTALNLSNFSSDGQTFQPKANDTWVRAKILPRETENLAIGGSRKMLAGLVQVDVFAPRKNGYTTASTIADTILAAFEPSSYSLATSDRVIIYASWVEASREEPTYLHLPMFIRWSAII